MRRPAFRWLAAYGVAAVVFAAIDVVWIGVVAANLYASQIGHLLADEFNLAAAALFDLLYVAGVVHYGVRPLDPDATLLQRVGGGALFGFFTYVTWDLTSLAVFRDFPAIVAVVDIAWGVTVCSVVTLLTSVLLRKVIAADADPR